MRSVLGYAAARRTGSAGRRRATWSALLLVAASLAACSDDEAAAPEPVAWTKVDLPAEPVVLSGNGAQLLVGLRDRDAKVAPRLVLFDGERQQEIAVAPKSPYAFEAIWQSIAYDGRRLVALGGAAGGAHSNTRWTVWTGTTSKLTEYPQEFNTFGGQTAGALFSAVIASTGQALLGSWGSSTSGLDGAVWLPEGPAKWVRQDSAGTALRSTPSLLVGPSYGTSAGPSIVQTGSQVRIAPNVVQQEAAVWRSADLNQGWSRVALPEPGNRSQGVSMSCSTSLCTIAGYVDGKLALWQLEPDKSGDAGAKRLAGVPDLTVGDKDKLPPPIDDAGQTVQLIAQGNQVKLVRSGDGTWTVHDSTGANGAAGPEGIVKDARLVGRTLYLVAGPADGQLALWKTELS
ncbi:hypothetical protein FB561_4206 [Kribbella amoyensis]|uniref:Uncharacterized protein n=1 Tax=Kribbella amoyensis TaxID=996641 RepID=A0A561BW15_9ACTN|nr:hypothetical protein [Kribbella amoyensis]TWD83051.1 hypothetical protein FB561_4206 [Kribbella amoyensis]